MADADYVCTLTKASEKKALDELHEDPKNRLGAINTLRDWVKSQDYLNFPTDTHPLLQILRYAKFSQLKARETIEAYCTMITNSPTWFHGYDVFDKDFIEFMKLGVMVPLPGVNKEGQKVLLYRAGAWDPKAWKSRKEKMIKGFYTMFHWMLHDENAQVNGLLFLEDMGGITMAHHTFYTMEEMKMIMKNWQKSFPARYKGFYMYNLGPVFDAMMEMVMPFLSKKFKDRMKPMGSNMVDVYKYFPKESLPVEYLPDDYTGPNAGSLDSIINDMINQMQKPDMVKYLTHISDPKWGIDKSKRPEKGVPQASFRKLNVD